MQWISDQYAELSASQEGICCMELGVLLVSQSVSQSDRQTGGNWRTILNGHWGQKAPTKQYTTVVTNGTHTGVTTLKSIGRANWWWLRGVHLRVTPTSTSRCQRLLSRRWRRSSTGRQPALGRILLLWLLLKRRCCLLFCVQECSLLLVAWQSEHVTVTLNKAHHSHLLFAMEGPFLEVSAPNDLVPTVSSLAPSGFRLAKFPPNLPT